MTEATFIFHIACDADVERYQQQGEYHCDSLDSEGFIHCCDKAQLSGVVNRYYHQSDDIQLLLIDPDKLSHPLIRENTVGGSELFPHVYGVINSEAISSIVPFGLSSIERQGISE